MSLVRWVRGGEAHVLSISADTIVLRSTVPAPPGSRVEGTVEADGRSLVVRVKVHGCRRGTESEFLIEGRPLDLTREVREYLQTTIRTTSPC